MSSDLHLKMASNDKKDGRVHDSRRDSLERGYKPFRGNPEREPPKETNRDDPHSLRCRVFIGNLQMSRKELEDAFSQYGRVTGCSVHNNYGFVQFEDEKAADVAVAQENGKVYYGKRVDVNLAGERRKETRGDKKMERDSRPPPFPPNRREREFDRDVGRPYRKSPPRERPRFEDYDRFPSRFEAPYDRRGRSPSPPPPRRTDERPYGRQDDYYMREQREQRERYRAEPYNREPYPRHSFDHRGGESFERDRRDPYDSPRAPYPDRSGDDRRDRFDSYSRDYSRPDEHPSPAKRPKMDYEASSSLDDIYSSKSIEAPTDCVIVVMNKQQRGYAEMVERRLKSVGLVVELHFHGTQPITELLDDVARRGVLYAIVITSQHEVHRSVTVNILHGTPQEHRNMPLDDAMRLVGQNFEKYMQDLRERARLSSSSSAPSQESSKPATSAPPKEQKSEVSQLLSKAATGDDLSADQLTKLIDSLSKRQEELIGSTTTANGKGGSTASHSSQPAVDPQSIAKQQADLQAKILSILNPGGASKTGATSAASNMTFSQSTSQKLGSIAASTVQKPIAPAALSTNTKPIFPLYPAQKPAASAPTGGYMSTSSSGVTSSRVLPVATTARSASSLSGNQIGKPYSAVSRFESSGSTSQYAGAASAAGKQNQPFQFSKPSAPASQGTIRGVAASSNALGSKVAVSPAAQSYSATTKNLQGQTGRAVSATAQPLSSATSAAKSPIQVASQPSKFSPAISQPSKFSPAGQAIMTVGGGSPRTVVSAAPRQPVPTGGPRMSSPMGAPRAVTSIAGSQTRSPSPVAARGRGVMSAGTGTPPRGLTPTRGIRPSLGAPGARMMAPRAPVPVSGTGRSTTPLGTTRAPTPGGMQVARGRGVPARGRAAGGVTGSPYSTSSPSQGYSSSQGVSSPQLAQKSPGALSGAGRGSTAPANTPPSRGVPVRRGVPVTRGALPMRGGGAGVRGGPSTRGALLARPQGPGGPVRGGALRGGAPRGALISGGPPPRGGLVARGGPLSRGAPRGRVLIRGGPYRGGPGRGAPGGHSGYGPSQGYGY